jgi:hypothetical protein
MNNKFIEILGWETTCLSSINEVLDTLKLLLNTNWITRGQTECWGTLIPKIDRMQFDQITTRELKIRLEKESIQLFQSTARAVGPKYFQKNLMFDINTLMILQHYGVPTRLLDWSQIPYVSAFFACFGSDDCDGELWGFDYQKYIEQGNKQWENYPLFPVDSKIEVRYAMAFAEEELEPDFFMCVYDYLGFDRILAQYGLFSMTASFGIDHAKSISNLFKEDRNFYHRYIINSDLKVKLLQVLHEDFGIWQDSLFPNIAIAANEVKEYLYKNEKSYR